MNIRLVLLSLGVVLCVPFWAGADAVVVTSRGISGDMDSQGRDPVLSVGRNVTADNVKLLVDAYFENKQYNIYPIRFEFYINRQLVLTQIRSPEQPGPVGMDVSTKTTPIPFNYSVVACMLHPVYSYCTVINGAAQGVDNNTKYSCSATVTDPATDEAVTYSAADVMLETQGENSYALTFTGRTEGSDPDEATVAAALKISGESASAAITISTGTPGQAVEASGTVTSKDGKPTAFNLESADGAVSLECDS